MWGMCANVGDVRMYASLLVLGEYIQDKVLPAVSPLSIHNNSSNALSPSG